MCSSDLIDFLRIPRPFVNLTERQTLTRIKGSNEIITLAPGYYTLKDLNKELEDSSVIELKKNEWRLLHPINI